MKKQYANRMEWPRLKMGQSQIRTGSSIYLTHSYDYKGSRNTLSTFYWLIYGFQINLLHLIDVTVIKLWRSTITLFTDITIYKGCYSYSIIMVSRHSYELTEKTIFVGSPNTQTPFNWCYSIK